MVYINMTAWRCVPLADLGAGLTADSAIQPTELRESVAPIPPDSTPRFASTAEFLVASQATYDRLRPFYQRLAQL